MPDGTGRATKKTERFGSAAASVGSSGCRWRFSVSSQVPYTGRRRGHLSAMTERPHAALRAKQRTRDVRAIAAYYTPIRIGDRAVRATGKDGDYLISASGAVTAAELLN